QWCRFVVGLSGGGSGSGVRVVDRWREVGKNDLQDNGSFVDKIIFDLNRAPDSPHLHTISLNQFRCFHCKDVLRDGEVCKRCTCAKCGSGIGKGLCYICGHNQNSLNDSPRISETSSQSPLHINHCCYECGDPLDDIFCKRCTCKSCGKDDHIGYNCPPTVPLPVCYNDDDDEERSDSLDDNIIFGLSSFSAITPNEPVLSTEETDNSLSMGDEHLDTIPTTKSEELIKSSVENLVLILSESEGIPDTILEVAEIVIPKDEEIEDDNLREKLLKVNLLIAKIKALKENSTPSFEFLTKSSSIFPKSFLEETSTFDDSLPEFENFCFYLEEISSSSTTTHSDISLPDYEAFFFYDGHIKEISSGSTTTHSDIFLSEYDSFIFDLSNDQCPPTDRSDFTHEEFTDELAHIIYIYWIEDDHSPLLAYVVWIFLAYLTYPVIPPHLYSFRNKDTIFDPGITINRLYSFKPGLSRRCGSVKKFNTQSQWCRFVVGLSGGGSGSGGEMERSGEERFAGLAGVLVNRNSNNDYSSNDDTSLYNENIEYVEASPHDSELVSLEVAEIVIPKDEEIEDDNLREKLLKVNLLIAKIEALKENSTQSFEFLTKSSSTFPKSVLEETSTFDDSLSEFENFCFHLEEISSSKISSGSTTTHSDISLSEYDSFIFDLSNDQCPPTDRSDFTHEEFADELAHIISLLEYDCFYFGNLPDPDEWISCLNFEICENISSTTCVNLPVKDDHSPLLAYVVWIFLAYLTYPVIPPHLYSFRNKDTIFDPCITINRLYSFKPGLSHRCGSVKKFNTHHSHLNECPMMINGKNTPILDVLLFHFYPP
nr:hypothetical protein [Tanacetum cinerariifolium]